MDLFHSILYIVQNVVKENGIFRPAVGDIPRQMRERLIHGSTGSFAVFAHFVFFVVQTPTAYVVLFGRSRGS